MTKSIQKTGRIAGILLLMLFILGVVIFQFLQGPYLFSEHFMDTIAKHEFSIISSTLLAIVSGILSIGVAVLLLPVFKNYNTFLASLYMLLTLLSCIAIVQDNMSVIELLESSKAFQINKQKAVLETLGAMAYQKHYWTHHFYLLFSCFPAFVLYYLLFQSRLVPKGIAVLGIIAVVLMAIEMVFTLFGNSISLNLLLPIAVIQLVLPIWLIIKGFNLGS